MRNIDAGILAQLRSEEFRPFLLLDMEISSIHYRYTDCDVPIVYDGDAYIPRGFRPEAARYGGGRVVDHMRVEIDNLDGVMTSLFVGGVPQGSQVMLLGVVMDAPETRPSDAITLFQGTIDDWRLDEETVSMTVASVLSQWGQKTLAKYSASCRVKRFKGAVCGYAGPETWCDRTYARCQALGNTANFRGFRWLPDIMQREVWWGRQPAN